MSRSVRTVINVVVDVDKRRKPLATDNIHFTAFASYWCSVALLCKLVMPEVLLRVQEFAMSTQVLISQTKKGKVPKKMRQKNVFRYKTACFCNFILIYLANIGKFSEIVISCLLPHVLFWQKTLLHSDHVAFNEISMLLTAF